MAECQLIFQKLRGFIQYKSLNKELPYSTIQACHLDNGKQQIGASSYYLCNSWSQLISGINHEIINNIHKKLMVPIKLKNI